MKYPTLRYRNIHLDFHTSEHILGVGEKFNPENFASVLKNAYVDSITLFAKCHHGWSYYPSKIGAMHPHLVKPDLLGEMIKACAKLDIQTPIYLSVQWDERNARLHPEWRVMSATNHVSQASKSENSALNQLSDTWHTLCLNHLAYRSQVMEHAREVLEKYSPLGLFFDIIVPTDCVCPACIDSMNLAGRDPKNPSDRRANDLEVNEKFRIEMTTMLHKINPKLRIFYNSGHIAKLGKQAYSAYSHLEVESLPTGGWGYNHFPSSARYVEALGMDSLAHTGKFHSSWGEFGGFKSSVALEYECAQMVALGTKCMIGDQLHPSAEINEDTYKLITPAYKRIFELEPYLEGAKQKSEIAILSAEYYQGANNLERNNVSDDGAVSMLLELHKLFDVIDETMDFSIYRLIILPDDILMNENLISKINTFLENDGSILLSSNSAIDIKTNNFAFDMGLEYRDEKLGYNPIYAKKIKNQFCEKLPKSPFVVYCDAKKVFAKGAEVLLDLYPPYFNRSYKRFCSHMQTPDNPNAPSLGAGASIFKNIGYISFSIFSVYNAIGQPLYKYIIDEMIKRLMPNSVLECNLPSSGRVSLTRQEHKNRSILHLLYASPQVRGHNPINFGGEDHTQKMEMIEDIPTIGSINVILKMSKPPKEVYDVLSKEQIPYEFRNEKLYINISSLKCHKALAIID